MVPPYAVGRPHQDRASARAHGLQARLQDRTLQANMRDRLLDFLGFRPNARALERMDPRSLAHRERQPLRARRRFRRRRFAHPKEPRHRRALAIVRLQSDPGRRGLQHPQRTLACRPRHQSNPRNAPLTLRTDGVDGASSGIERARMGVVKTPFEESRPWASLTRNW